MHRVFFLVLIGISNLTYAAESELGYQGKGGQVFGFKTVLEALEALKSDPNVEIRESDGWVIINDNTNKTLWSFAPKDHPSYPSVVRRAAVERGGQIGITTQVKCSASRVACDSLVKDFMELNRKVKSEVTSN
ncbi:molecular chaperone DnaJ [Pseudoalteromonas sp. T1lg48]|uniref:molecular chaperone DnaJ n=1 Tax=Pseudoalteromonas sp. T1lg48 TaxID=2077100 RepID=UPI000CF6F3E8|nr:molecular chaperone DnaJ [Pseudoalteromonas sp. T1lg48]